MLQCIREEYYLPAKATGNVDIKAETAGVPYRGIYAKYLHMHKNFINNFLETKQWKRSKIILYTI